MKIDTPWKIDPAWLKRTLDTLFGVDLRSLALFRALLGTVLFIDLWHRLADLSVFYTDAGVMPRDWAMSVAGAWRLSLHFASGERWFGAAMILTEMVAALGVLFGWRARACALLAMILHASLLNRNILVTIGGDTLLVCLLFWASMLPIAARWSVDAALSNTPAPSDNAYRSGASAGLILQVLSVYFFSAALKNGHEWWPDGTAVDYAMQIDAYTTTLGLALRQFPGFESGLTYFVYFLELLGPALALSLVFNAALRFIVMVLLMLMHIGFILCLNVEPFPWISLCSLTTLAGGWIWNGLEQRLSPSQPMPLRIYYDQDCGFCLKSVLLFRVFLALQHARIAPAQPDARAHALMQANNSWVVIDHDDHAYLKWPAFVTLLRRSPLFAWLGRLVAGEWANKPGNAVYDFVARNRGFFGAWSAWAWPFHSRSFAPGAFTQRAAGAFAGVLLAWNFCTVHWLPNPVQSLLAPPLNVLRLDQYWDMFAPFPSHEDGWYVIPAQQLGGGEIDLMHPSRERVDYSKPVFVAHEFRNIRWHKYLERLWMPEFASSRAYYGKYLCRTWNATHSGGAMIKSLKLVYMLETSVPIGQTPTIEQRVLLRQDCTGSKISLIGPNAMGPDDTINDGGEPSGDNAPSRIAPPSAKRPKSP